VSQGRGRDAALARALGALAGLLGSLPLSAEPVSARRADPLDTWDHSIAVLRERIWAGYVATAAVEPDSRGRTIGDDYREWIATPEALDELQRARNAAGERAAAADAAGVADALRAGDAVRRTWSSRLDLLEYYWGTRFLQAQHHARWQRWAARVAPEMKAASVTALERAAAALAAHVMPSATKDQLAPYVLELNRAYNAERERLALLVGAGGGDLVPAPRARQRPCPKAGPAAPAEAPANAVNRAAALVAGAVADELYPVTAQSRSLWGNVRLRIAVSAGGCPTRAEVLGSSGSAELDAAAIGWAEVASFTPAVDHGRPLAVDAVVRVSFALGDERVVDAAAGGALRADALPPPLTSLSVLGGVALGITRRELLRTKGRPAASGAEWSYNSVDAAHDGLISVYFAPGLEADEDTVIHVEYLGDRESAPRELPVLKAMSQADLAKRYGAPTRIDAPAAEVRRLVFRNGLVVVMYAGKVQSYGITNPRLFPPPAEVRAAVETQVPRA
jgi:TonB family protein